MKIGAKEAVFFVKAKRFVEMVRDGHLTQELFEDLADAYDDADAEILGQIEKGPHTDERHPVHATVRRRLPG